MKAPARDDCDFHFDEMVWRTDSGLIHQALTELTSIRDDLEFEREILLIRKARFAAGLGNQRLVYQPHTGLSCARFQRFFERCFGVCLMLSQACLRSRELLLQCLPFRVGKIKGHDQEPIFNGK